METEWALIAACRAGSRRAFEPLVRRHERRALSVAEALLGDADEAADAVQDAFVKAYRTLGRLGQDSEFGPWFHAILRNHCLDLLRAAPRRTRVSLERSELRTYGADAAGSAAIEQEQLAAAVWRALGRLTPEHRQILVLKEIEGMSYADIALAAGIPAGTVASRLHHARAALRAEVLADVALSDGAA
ncbi:MAG TPA: sigma-70 family RNA polymerase sigma factor [Longimicrobiales bacterium]|nr:sigma-70 family RNA polymerase sigma factor [Longimicrobiales bacterium]